MSPENVKNIIPTVIVSVAALVGCQTTQPPSSAQVQAPDTVSFIDLQGFDQELQNSLKANEGEVKVIFLEKPSPNKLPERIQKWIAKVRENGGRVQIESPPNELAPKNPLALISLFGSLFSGAKAVKQISQDAAYGAIKGRNAVLQLERNSKKELVLGQITFVKP
jgi:hypothetical protein